MSTISFVKYHGAGNDFILIDDRALFFDSTQVPSLCHRKFGIGADGLILLQPHDVADFRMRIFNSDGSEAESCGNGLRCLMQFLLHLGLPKKSYRIATADRIVEASFVGEKISINMGKPLHVKQLYMDRQEVHFLDTGVPHTVLFVPDVHSVDLPKNGADLRYHAAFQPRGTNVNFAALQADGSIQVRTYERGLEGETLACGTGAVAVAFAAAKKYKLPNPIHICFPGGTLEMYVEGEEVRMVGEAVKVFEGSF
jgi:diaminopimelate epimerase